MCLCRRPLVSATSFSRRSAIKSRSTSSASKPTSSSTSPLMFCRYCSASRSRRSAFVSSASSDSSSDTGSLSSADFRRASSSDSALEIDSSRRARAVFAVWGFAFTLVFIFLRFVEGVVLASSRLRFLCEAGAVKKVDIAERR